MVITPPERNFNNKNAYCCWCGSKFAEQIIYPRRCFRCDHITYINPTPVVVAMIPVWKNIETPHQAGLLIGKRNIDPKKGQWALPGGFLDINETWQTGCAREVLEEIGLETDPNLYRLVEVSSSTNNNILIFGEYCGTIRWNDIKFVPNEETSEIDLVHTPTELAFPTHTQVVTDWCNDG